MTKFKVGDKVKYKWCVIPEILIPAEILEVYETIDGYYYVVSSGAIVPEEVLIKIVENE